MKIQKIITLTSLVLLVFLLRIRSNFNTQVRPKIIDAPPAVPARYVFPSDSVASVENQTAATSSVSFPPTQPQNASASGDFDPANPQIQARIAYAGTLLGQKDWYARNINERWPLASLTKIMTAVVALKHISADDIVTIPQGAFALSRGEVDEVDIREGERYAMKDLLAMALLPSSNKAADALAAVVGRDAFISEMNAQAASWGMDNTHYEEPTGLSVLNQSTAEDLKALAEHVYRDYPQIFALTRQEKYTATELQSGRTFTFQSINQFAGRSGFLGGKTGYTDDANGNLLSLFLYRNNPTFFVVMGTSDRFQDTQILIRWLNNMALGG
jgi:D-alanyl-D-alanine carboxypeptidase